MGLPRWHTVSDQDRTSSWLTRPTKVLLACFTLASIVLFGGLSSIHSLTELNAPSFLYEDRLVFVTGLDSAALSAISDSLLLVGDGFSSLELPQDDIDSLLTAISGVDYDIEKLPRDISTRIRDMVASVGIMDSQVVVSEHVAFLLPFIREAFPTFTLVHVVQEGIWSASAVADSEIAARVGEKRWTPELILKPAVPPDPRAPPHEEAVLRAARVWLTVNLGLRAWGKLAQPGVYQLFRVEDLCHIALSRHLAHYVFETLVIPSKLDAARPRHEALCLGPQSASAIKPAFLHSVIGLIRPGLDAFGYDMSATPPQASPETEHVRSQLATLVEPGQALTLVTTDEDYLSVFLNWALFYNALNTSTMPPVIVATQSQSTHRLLVERCFPAIFVPISGSGRGAYWRWRLSLVNTLVLLGHDVLVSDSDAVWLADPWPLLSGAPDADLIGSRGLSRTMRAGPDNTASFCMGWAYFAARPATTTLLLHAMYTIVRVPKPDDQRVVNEFLSKSFAVSWDRHAGVADDAWSRGQNTLLSLRVALAPQNKIRRDCDKSGTMLNATVLHCLTKGHGGDKQAAYERLGMWRIREDWPTWWEQLPHLRDRPWPAFMHGARQRTPSLR